MTTGDMELFLYFVLIASCVVGTLIAIAELLGGHEDKQRKEFTDE